MQFFHEELAARGLLSVHFNFDYIEQGRKVPDPQPKLQARYRKVVDEVAVKYQPRRLIIGGKSMGGRVASYIAADTPHVAGLVFLGYPLHPPGAPTKMRDAHLYSIPLPMIFVTGTKDTFAERPLLENVTQKIGDRATLKWIDGGDHSLQVKRGDKSRWPVAVDLIVEWLSRV